MNKPLGYVVIEWNQASGQPDLLTFGNLYASQEDADEVAKASEAVTSAAGRKERYTVAEVTELDQ
jgi:hypothetical protein